MAGQCTEKHAGDNMAGQCTKKHALDNVAGLCTQRSPCGNLVGMYCVSTWLVCVLHVSMAGLFTACHPGCLV